MGEKQNQPFQLSFNASLKIDFQGSRLTSDAGLILVRELDERLGFAELIQRHLTDSRRGKNTQFPFVDLLRQSVYSRLAGYEDLNDAEGLSHDRSRAREPVASKNSNEEDISAQECRDRSPLATALGCRLLCAAASTPRLAVVPVRLSSLHGCRRHVGRRGG